MTSLPSLSELHALSASTLDTEMKRDRAYYENDGWNPALTAAVKAFVLIAQAHIEATMGNDRRVAPFFYDPSQRGGEGADVTATRQALEATYLQLRKVWLQTHFLLPPGGQPDPQERFEQTTAKDAPELCLIYAVHFAYVGEAGMQAVVESMLRCTQQWRDDKGASRTLSSALMSIVPPDGADIPRQVRAKELSFICLASHPSQNVSPATVSEIVRDLTLPPAIEYWYERLKK